MASFSLVVFSVNSSIWVFIFVWEFMVWEFWSEYSLSFFFRYFRMAVIIICMSSRSWRIRMKEVFSLVSKVLIFLVICFSCFVFMFLAGYLGLFILLCYLEGNGTRMNAGFTGFSRDRFL